MRIHLAAALIALAAPAGGQELMIARDGPQHTVGAVGALIFAQSYSCSPRKTCKRIASCEEAVWLLENCSWGGRLDRDGDGVPCESLC